MANLLCTSGSRRLVTTQQTLHTLVSELKKTDPETDYYLEIEMLKSSLSEIEGKFPAIEGALGG